jgi:hypothetical protein
LGIPTIDREWTSFLMSRKQRQRVTTAKGSVEARTLPEAYGVRAADRRLGQALAQQENADFSSAICQTR